jgi:hypothetical protein
MLFLLEQGLPPGLIVSATTFIIGVRVKRRQTPHFPVHTVASS